MKVVVFVLIGILFCVSARPLAAEESEGKDALSVIHSRKSVRHYLERPVTKESLDVLLRAGMAAPTAGDKRPWAFVAVTEKARLEKLAEALPYGQMLRKAGAAVVVCGIPKKSFPGREREYWVQDCSAATENILLAAEAMGLGAVWIGVYPVTERADAVRKELGIPGDVTPLNVISVGYPAGIEQPKNKYDPANIHWEKW